MKQLANLLRAWRVPELRKKIIFTALVLIVFRLVAHIPASGVDHQALRTLFAQSPFLSLLDIFSGGTLANFSILALGLNPYINASIILQLLMVVFPSLKELSREGEAGRAKINQYTRFLTIPLAAVQAISVYFLLANQQIVPSLAIVPLVVLIVTMTAGTVLAMWLGELITEYGIGNGISLLIFAGIVGRLPVYLSQTITTTTQEDFFSIITFALASLLIVGGVVFANEATRRVPIQYARSGARGGVIAQQTHLPLRLNQGGVFPIIFASSLVLAPSLIGQVFAKLPNEKLAWLGDSLQNWFNPNALTYNVAFFFLVIGFTFFTTVIFFNPTEVADDIKKHGGFIPGTRPGSQTTNYLNHVLTRITLAGGIFLGVLAVLPAIVQGIAGTTAIPFGSTGVLIVVSVVLETIKKIESQLVMRNYDKFLQ